MWHTRCRRSSVAPLPGDDHNATGPITETSATLLSGDDYPLDAMTHSTIIFEKIEEFPKPRVRFWLQITL